MIKQTITVLQYAFISIFIPLSCADKETEIVSDSSTVLFFNDPASVWHEAIPVGNGRLGGMIYGGIGQERIQTNDDTFWSGEPRNLQEPSAATFLPQIRKLLSDEKNLEAQKMIDTKMLGPWNQCYMPLADILLNMGSDEATEYRRELDLNRGVVTITYKQGGVRYKREIFASYPDQALIIRLSADKKKSLNFSASLESLVKNRVKAENGQVIMNGQAPIEAKAHYEGKHDPVYQEGHGMRFEGRLFVVHSDGDILTRNECVELNNASSVTLAFVAATSFNGYDKDPFKDGKDETAICSQYAERLKERQYKELYTDHVKDFDSLFGRVSICLGDSPESQLPINERIKGYKPETDPSLTALYFQFGRYLLISSSRSGSQPANLQGIWNNLLQPAWGSNWTINCNAQINYWPVEITNLPECHLPLIDMVQDITVDGAKTAKTLYNSRGWMAHHNVDIWRTTWPVGGSGLWAIYQVGGAWLCQHIWEHFQFTQDEAFLKKYYPVLKGACLFYLDNLQKDKDGYWVTNPSESFENEYIKPNGEKGWACMGAAQDMQIIRSLFKNTMQTINLLQEDLAFKEEIQSKYNDLAPMKISPRTGRLQEWNDDWEAAVPTNGQVAHGWGFVASDLITLRGTPELAGAFRKTIEYRKPGYSYNSGSWTGSFPANFWARFEEGDSVQKVIDRHFTQALFPNLTSKFFGEYWEIDGNLGITAAIAEMLLQSHAGEINLLPALPSRYPAGYVKGLRARNACEVGIAWKDGLLVSADIKSDKGGSFIVRYKDKTKNIIIKPGGVYHLKSFD